MSNFIYCIGTKKELSKFKRFILKMLDIKLICN